MMSAAIAVLTFTGLFAAQVQVGASPTGPFTSVSGSKTTTARTVYAGTTGHQPSFRGLMSQWKH